MKDLKEKLFKAVPHTAEFVFAIARESDRDKAMEMFFADDGKAEASIHEIEDHFGDAALEHIASDGDVYLGAIAACNTWHEVDQGRQLKEEAAFDTYCELAGHLIATFVEVARALDLMKAMEN